MARTCPQCLGTFTRAEYSNGQWKKGATRGRCKGCSSTEIPEELKEKWNEAKQQVNDYVKDEEEKMHSNLPSRENGDRGAHFVETPSKEEFAVKSGVAEEVLGQDLQDFGLVAEYNDEIKAKVAEVSSRKDKEYPVFEGLFSYIKERKELTDDLIRKSPITLTPNEKGEVVAVLNGKKLEAVKARGDATEQMNCYRIQAAADEYLRYIDNSTFASELAERHKKLMAARQKK